jgi:hypothetical protein
MIIVCTPHTNLNIMYWHAMNLCEILCRPIPVILLRIYMCMEMKPNFVAEQGCGVDFLNIHCLKVLVHKIQFCYMIYILEFLNNSCHTWT